MTIKQLQKKLLKAKTLKEQWRIGEKIRVLKQQQEFNGKHGIIEDEI